MSKKIMIVDDEPGVVAVIQSYFETMDYQVITAHNGSDAMKKWHKRPILFCWT